MKLSTHRSPVYSRHGIIAASQPLAVSAGIEILRRGGSAIDAAIAVSALLAVVEPGASHLGGDAFVITHQAKERENLAFNGSGEAPHLATREAFGEKIDHHGYRSATLPGLVSTWFAAHDQFGQLPMAEILEPAIEYAQFGFPVNPGFIRRINHHLREFPETELFTTLGFPKNLTPGEILIQSDLATTLLAISEEGREAFYQGWIAEKLIESSHGWFSAEDLARHQTRVSKPLSITYRDFIIHGQPPPSQGMILLEELKLVERFNLAELSEQDRIHLMVEAKKLAFEDRYRLLGDPEFVETKLEELFSELSIKERSLKIDPLHAAKETVNSPQEGSDTTYFLTADRDGNAVSWIQSVFHGFGASWAIPNTGIILNNRLTGFSLDSNSPNFLQPGRRPAHTLNAWSATRKDGSLALVGGTPGANIQVQTNFQLLVNAIDLKMNPQENAEAPRWQHLRAPGDSSLEENFDGVLQIENRLENSLIEALHSKGHLVEPLPPFGHGSSVQLLEVLPNGTYIAGSDPRSEGHASGI
jgi:gamma-glutamyltranspeptidase/glutathione hydrolase